MIDGDGDAVSSDEISKDVDVSINADDVGSGDDGEETKGKFIGDADASDVDAGVVKISMVEISIADAMASKGPNGVRATYDVRCAIRMGGDGDGIINGGMEDA